GVFVFIIIALGIATLTCILIRHQTMMPDSSRWKIRKVAIFLIYFITFCFYHRIAVLTIQSTLRTSMQRETIYLQSRFELGWVRTRGPYFRFPDTIFVHVIMWTAKICLLMCLVTVTTPFWHMFYVLKQQTNKSERSKVLIRQSLMRLCTQFVSCLYLLFIS
ncbi:hypothetical protein PMAYCL1PPCAC_20080, partial [Pristionchus mayeri]